MVSRAAVGLSVTQCKSSAVLFSRSYYLHDSFIRSSKLPWQCLQEKTSADTWNGIVVLPEGQRRAQMFLSRSCVGLGLEQGGCFKGHIALACFQLCHFWCFCVAVQTKVKVTWGPQAYRDSWGSTGPYVWDACDFFINICVLIYVYIRW